MKSKKSERKTVKTPSPASVRASISFPPETYQTLENIAKEKRVSLAWVVREATEKYIEDKWPLFGKEGQSS
jgi:metal-responsive CopG/Arc/MetJ family transcriptional regulator